MLRVNGVLETALYVEDVERSKAFYESLFRWTMDSDPRICAFDVRDGQVFLLFKKGGALRSVSLPGGIIPGHDASGQSHTAFAIAASDWDAWKARLEEKGIPIEATMNWP
jgi:predicted enzyme related to lactoylglutathione lyase